MSNIRHALAIISALGSAALAGCSSGVTQVAGEVDPAKAQLWSRAYGGQFDDFGVSLVVGADEHARFLGHGLLDGSADVAETRPLLMDIDGDGTTVAQERLGDSSLYPIDLRHATQTKDGGLVLAGHFTKTLTKLRECTLSGGPGGGEFIASFDLNGHCAWARSFVASVYFESIDTNANGEILIAAGAKPGASLGPGVDVPDGGADSSRFYASFSSDGAAQFARTIPGTHGPVAAYFDQQGGVLITSRRAIARHTMEGATSWSTNIPDATPLVDTVRVGDDLVVATTSEGKVSLWGIHSSTGNQAWSLDIQGGAAGARGGIVLGSNADHQVAIAGHFPAGQDLTIGTTPLLGKGADNLFWALVDDKGQVLKTATVPSTSTVVASGVSTNNAGSVWLLGAFTGPIDFGDGAHPGHPISNAQPGDPTGYDVFLARFP